MIDQLWISRGLDAAIEMAEKGWREGGIPIGSSLLDARGNVVAAGHNQRVQSGDPTAHAEVDCIRRAGRRRDWPSLTLVSTLSPCCMCSGTAWNCGSTTRMRVITGDAVWIRLGHPFSPRTAASVLRSGITVTT